jgi:hypothetical protein
VVDEGEKRERRENVVQRASVCHIEVADVAVMPDDPPQVFPGSVAL